MRAIQCTDLKGPGALRLTDVPTPACGPEQVLIEVWAVGISFVDVLLTRGMYQDRPVPPFIPGIEVAGIVVAAPRNSRHLVGDRVAAYVGTGGLAEYVVADEKVVMPLPTSMDFAAAAALVVNYHTAYFALVHRGRVEAGEDVLVHGAAGGVGSAAVQVAAALDASVTAVVGDLEKAPVARSAGAHHVVLLEEWLHDEEARRDSSDIVLDPVGEPVFNASLRALRPDGRYLILGFASGGIPSIKANRVLLRNVSLVGVAWGGYLNTSADSDYLQKASAWISERSWGGVLRPVVGKTYRFEDTKAALDDVEARRARGKGVVIVRD